jgi:hypothetical protein
MADTKITALTAITTVDPAVDVLPIVDISDTTMAASGTTKKITSNQILGAGGTATLASATITGDLTVDTSTLKVASGSNQVGVGITTFTGTQSLQVLTGVRISDANPESLNCLNLAVTSTTSTIETRYGTPLIFGTNATECYRIAAGGTSTWSVGGSTAMTLNSTGLGVGASSPAYKLDVRTAPATAAIEGSRVYDGTRNFIIGQTGATYSYIGIGANQNAIYTSNSRLDIAADGQSIFLRSSATNYLNLDASGNVGIGVTPSAWGSGKAIEVLEKGYGIWNGSGSSYLLANAYFNSGFKYANTGSQATHYYQYQGTHVWSTAASGTAGNAITFTQAMTLDASGNLILLSSNTPATLTTNGQLTVNATSNTNLRFSYRGSDGTTRVANITLA